LAVLLLAGCEGAPPATPETQPPPVQVTIYPSATPSASPTPESTATPSAPTATPEPTPLPTPTPLPPHPLQIDVMRQRDYPGSDIEIEETLAPGSNYDRHIASYQSDGLKIYALLTVPRGEKPADGWPVVVFNHGYIPPAQYRTTERYVAYVDAFARSGYIVFRPDYRGHGSSEGTATGGYGTPDYTVDVLNALGSIKRHADADPNRIGMWGHSMGGQITLRAMVTVKDIKAGVIWAGVVAPYPDLVARWRRNSAGSNAGSSAGAGGSAIPATALRWRDALSVTYGAPDVNPAFWASISPNSFLSEGVSPIQIHHGDADTTVPLAFSDTLARELEEAGQIHEYYVYPGDNHNLSNNLSLALRRSVAFFDRYVKGG
jgi:dienelactone hydrolase